MEGDVEFLQNGERGKVEGSDQTGYVATRKGLVRGDGWVETEEGLFVDPGWGVAIDPCSVESTPYGLVLRVKFGDESILKEESGHFFDVYEDCYQIQKAQLPEDPLQLSGIEHDPCHFLDYFQSDD